MDSVPLVAITGQVGTPVIGTDAFQETPIVEVCRAITKHHYLVHAHRGHRRASSRRRSTSPAPAGPARSSSMCPRTCRSAQIVARLRSADEPARLPALPPGHAARAGAGARPDPPEPASRSSTPAAASSPPGRPPHLQGVRRAHRHPGRPDAARPGRLPQRAFPVPANARHARHRLRQLRHQRGRPAAGPRRPLRRPRHRQGQRVRQARQDRPHRHRPVGDQQEQGRPTCPIHRRRRPGACRTCCSCSTRSRRGRPAQRPLSPSGCGRSRTGARRSRCASPTATTPSCRSTPSSGCGRSSSDRGQLDDTIVTTGVGQHQMWAAQYFHFNQPRHWITSGGLGAMGFGLPSAIGAQAAHPEQDGHRHRRRRQLPDEHPGAGLLLHREAAGQGAAAEQPAPGHGGAVGGPLPRRQPRPHLPRRRPRRGAVSRFRDAGQGLPLRRPPHQPTRTTSTAPWKRCSTARGRTCST